MHRTPALIVGGGPAGAALAILLARGGASPLLIERQTRLAGIVCGGFLGWDARASLLALGVDPEALGAPRIDRVRLIAGTRSVEARLPHPAAGLSRPALDEALLARASDEGADVQRGVAVKHVDGDAVLLADGRRIAADALFVATGKHGVRGVPKRGDGTGAVGMRASIDPSADLVGFVELHMVRGGYAGLLIDETGRANLCLSIAADRLREIGGRDRLMAMLARDAPRLAERLGGVAPVWDTIAGVPYGWRAEVSPLGHYLVGDQAAVIASLAGDGVAIALASARAAATAHLAGQGAATFQRRFSTRARVPLLAADTLRAAAEHDKGAALLLGAARVPGAVGIAARLTRIGY